jgi:hypothetical protein
MIHFDTSEMAVEGRQDCADGKAAACMTDQRKIPVAYEEVTLTEEAVEILEKERKAAAERPARKIRRVADAR